jgi:protein phosphatase 1G
MDEVLVQPEHRAELAAYKNEGGEGGGRGGGRAGGMTINSSQLPEALLDALGMPGERGFVLKLVKAPNGRVQIDDIMDEEEEDPEEAAAAGGDDGGAAAGVEAAGSGAAAVAAAADGSSPFAAAAAAGEAPGGAGATQKRKRAVQAGGGSLGEAGADAEDGGEAADGVGAGAAAAAGVREVVVEELSSPRGEGGEGGEYGGPAAGCTAVCAVVRGDALVVANAGDSRCVLSRAGRAVAMTQDHKPNDPEEFARITAAGGFVADGRVNGSLNLSRALGDLEYKQARQLPPQAQAVTAFPEVRAERLQGGDEFLILACDGIWDVLTNQEAVDFVRARLAAGRTPAQVCADACDRCLAPDTAGCGKGCDNMSFVLVMLKAWAGGAAAAAP